MSYKHKSDEQKKAEWQAIREGVRITDLAEEYGFHLVRTGHYYSLKEHDSVRINTERNIFIRNSRPEAAGSCIDFAMEFGNYSNMHEVMVDFTNRIGGRMQQVQTGYDAVPAAQESKESVQSAEIQLPPRDSNVRNVFAYLTNTRKIEKSIVSDFIADHRLYQDQRKNCVFVSRDQEGTVRYAGLRGTNTYKHFMGDLEGCDYSHCFYVDNGADSLVVTESVIDTMSHMTFDRSNGFSDKQNNYLALSSANKYMAVKHHLEEHPEIKSLYLAFDNDEGGYKFCEATKKLVQDMEWEGTVIEDFPNYGKDWNEQLCYCKENGIRSDFFSPDNKTMKNLTEYCAAKYDCYRYGADPRAYTKAKKWREEALDKLMSDTDIPDGILDFTDMYYQNSQYLQRCSHSPETAANDIIDHYNHKNRDFSDVGWEEMQMQETIMYAEATYADGLDIRDYFIGGSGVRCHGQEQDSNMDIGE